MTMPRSYHRAYIREYYHEKRRELIKRLGGKCVECGSKINLQFDHKDPKNSVFKIGKLLSHSNEELEIEIKKCQLLCRKCHDKKSKKEGSFDKNRQKGSEIKSSKLNEEKVSKIKVMLRDKIPHQYIAKQYNVCTNTIKFISYGKTWKHVK